MKSQTSLEFEVVWNGDTRLPGRGMLIVQADDLQPCPAHMLGAVPKFQFNAAKRETPTRRLRQPARLIKPVEMQERAAERGHFADEDDAA